MFSRLQSGFLWVDCNFLRAYENWWNRTKVLPDAISYRCATVVPWRFPGHVMVGKWSPHFLSWSYQSRKELSWPIYASKWNNSCCGLNDHMPNRLLIYIYIYTCCIYHVVAMADLVILLGVLWFRSLAHPISLIFQAGNCHGRLYPRQLDQRAYDSLDVHTSSWEVDVSGLESTHNSYKTWLIPTW